MARKPGGLPPPDFLDRDLPIEAVPAGATLYRIHRTDLGAIYFGASGDNRFDDPERQYEVCYAARSLEGAFAETCLRQVGARLVTLSHLAARSVTELTVVTELRLVEVHGPGLARLGATAGVSSGGYQVSQAWSHAIHEHSGRGDGIVYRSNFDNGELCVALFARCRHGIRAGSTARLLADRPRLATLLDRYQVGIG